MCADFRTVSARFGFRAEWIPQARAVPQRPTTAGHSRVPLSRPASRWRGPRDLACVRERPADRSPTQALGGRRAAHCDARRPARARGRAVGRHG